MIPHDFIDELLSKVDIVEVIDQAVPLKKSGANYMACCPFHKEKSASFSVSPSKQFYHCFGCGAHGSAIGFIMEYQGLSFTEAVHYLADRVGLKVPHQNNELPENSAQREARKTQQQNMENVMNQAAAFYQQQLNAHENAKQYVQKRGLSSEIIAHYGIGYAPEGWTPLAKLFQPYPNEWLMQTGMVLDNEGRQYDRFRHRIMFPIRSATGQIIGFGGRVLDDSKPKYLNSPDTPLFDKGKNLYGLYEARGAIKEAQKILVVEGYMDVVALAQYGIGYAVASLGTATTADHIKILMRQTDDIYFCFDGDSAGKKAAWRALENALPQLKDNKTLHFLFLPEDHDPDSYVREFGKNDFEQRLQTQSQTLSAYFYNALTADLNLNQQESKAELVQRAAPLLKQINAPTLAFLLKQQLSELVGIDPSNLAHLIGQAAPVRHVSAKSYKLPRETFRQPEIFTLAQKQIRTLLFHPQWAKDVLLPDYLPLNDDYACFIHLAQICQRHPSQTIAQLLEHLRDTPYENTVNYLLQNMEHDNEYLTKNNESELSDKEAKQQKECQKNQQREFQEGIKRMIDELKKEQIQRLRPQAAQGDEHAKQLLLKLLTLK